MALTADFGGGALPTGWTFWDPNAVGATIDNSGDHATVTIPNGVTADGISSAGSVNALVGPYHLVSGDFDVAYRFDTCIGGDQSAQVGFNLRGANNTDMIRYTLFAIDDRTRQYGFARQGGAGNNFLGVNDLGVSSGRTKPWLLSHPSWLRAKRVGTTFTFYVSSDGVLWEQQATVTGPYDPQTITLAVGQYSQNLGTPIRIARCVDILTNPNGTDVREAIADLSPTNVRSWDATSEPLPSWLAFQADGDGTAFADATWAELSTGPLDGSGRIIYNGPTNPTDNVGILVRYQPVYTDGAPFIVVGLGVNDGGAVPMDNYMNGPGYGWEIGVANGEHVPVRAHRPISIDDFNEPYIIFQEIDPDLAVGAGAWARVEKIGSRLRMKAWLDGNAEPSTWNFDAEEDALRGLGPLEPYVSISTNPGNGGSAKARVFQVSTYDLAVAAPGIGGIPGVDTVIDGGTEVDRVYAGATQIYP